MAKLHLCGINLVGGYKMNFKFIMMVGLPGSGKSTKAKELAVKNGALIVSSDTIRKKLYGDENIQGDSTEVFNTMFNETLSVLKRQSVIYDATNLSIKNRRGILLKVQELENITKIAYVMRTPECKRRNALRDRVVPDEVIDRMYNNFYIPLLGEGFDEVVFDNIQYSDMFQDIENTWVNTYYNKMIGFEQHNKHHSLTLDQHCYNTYQHLVNYGEVKNKYISVGLLAAALLHDYGKLLTQSFDDNGEAHYYQHHCVGAYEIMASGIVDVQMPAAAFYRMIVMINYHMSPYNWKEDTTKQKYKAYLGDMYTDLIWLHNADKENH